jgi:Magnesium chelatase, subunit ChlI
MGCCSSTGSRSSVATRSGLRQPLEDGRVVVTRMAGSVMFPARLTRVGPPTRFALRCTRRLAYPCW